MGTWDGTIFYIYIYKHYTNTIGGTDIMWGGGGARAPQASQ